MKKLSMIIAVMCMMISPMMQAQNDGVAKDSIVGNYINEELDELEVYKVGDNFFGKIIELNVPFDPPQSNNPLLDKHNPVGALKTRKVKGITFLTYCQFDHDEWEKGRYYDHVVGETYDCKMRFIIDPQKKVKLSVKTYNSSGGGTTTHWTKKKTH